MPIIVIPNIIIIISIYFRIPKCAVSFTCNSCIYQLAVCDADILIFASVEVVVVVKDGG